MSGPAHHAAGRVQPNHRREVEKKEGLEETVTHMLEEARMLLPGIQALFGFQLIAVFQNVFHQMLDARQRQMHLFAMGLVALCVALVLAPAAYHRQAEPRTISIRFVRYSSWMLTIALVLLMTAISVDFYLITMLSGFAQTFSFGLSIGLFAVFFILWFLIPWSVRAVRRRALSGQPQSAKTKAMPHQRPQPHWTRPEVDENPQRADQPPPSPQASGA